MKIRHIYWFAYYNTSEPSIRYRAKYPLDELRQTEGIGYTLVTTGYDLKSILNFTVAYFGLLFFRKENSIIVFQKIRSRRIYGNALKLLLFFRNKKTLYDIDDPDYLSFSGATVQYFIRNCEVCFAGSVALMEYAQKLNGNVVLQTSPVVSHGVNKTDTNKVFTIGWIGYYSAHKSSLGALFFPALSDLDIPVKLVLLGVVKQEDRDNINRMFMSVGNVAVEMPDKVDWMDEHSVYQIIRTFDIGVSPLIDNVVNRSKSAFKLKQYLSCGVPVLASPVGENCHFLKEGVNGFFCKSPEEYRTKIKEVFGLSPEAYSRLSYNASASTGSFSMERYCKKLTGYYDNSVSRYE